jgi:hypothetical protein
MSARLVVGLVASLLVAVSCIASSLIMSEILERVNRRLPEDSHISPLGWYLTKTLYVLREYRRYYPYGNLVRALWLTAGLAFSSLLLCAWAVGFFSR